MNEGVPQKAIEACTRALEIDPEHIHAWHNRGLGYLELGQWKEGWEGYGWRWQSDSVSSQNLWHKSNAKEWDGNPGQRLVIHGEQGLGDEILFSTCLPDIIPLTEKIILDLNPKLDALFQRSFPDFIIDRDRPEVHGIKSEDCSWADKHNYDCKMPVGDLAKYFRNDDADFPRNRKLFRKLHYFLIFP